MTPNFGSDMNPRVKVFKDDPIWTDDRPWFTIPVHLLEPLYVGVYECPVDDDGDVIDPVACQAYLEAQHPGCIFIC